ncbi:MAG: hypothetical protein E7631_05885 [Ruminococcaceae bacterium]|nr:hypothetical protein [Oscillospiraceae bacterium]
MIVSSNYPLIRYTGRWCVSDTEAVSTATGSYAEFAFSGDTAVIEFDINDCVTPYPHVYISIDEGAKVEVPLDKYIRITAEEGNHSVQIILKSSMESQQRWFAPLQSKISIRTIEADEFLPLPPDTRPLIEFLGDSITEGVSIDNIGVYSRYGSYMDMVYLNDAVAGYAWLTAKALNLRPVIIGYGSLGVTRSGSGNVPPASQSYPYYKDGYPAEPISADFVVINHGTNDINASAYTFKQAYQSLLLLVRQRNPNAHIIALTPFNGTLAEEIRSAVENFNNEWDDSVFYINSTGWIPPSPIHPKREGHRIVSRYLSDILRRKFNL